MSKLVLIGALLAGCAIQPAWSADKAQKPKSTCAATRAAKMTEAEAGIRYMTELMVISSACQNPAYAEFRLHNREPILGYQKAMMVRLHGAASFDKWNTSLANQYAQRHNGINTAELCKQSETLLKQAAVLDPKGFHDLAVAQAAAATPAVATCAK